MLGVPNRTPDPRDGCINNKLKDSVKLSALQFCKVELTDICDTRRRFLDRAVFTMTEVETADD